MALLLRPISFARHGNAQSKQRVHRLYQHKAGDANRDHNVERRVHKPEQRHEIRPGIKGKVQQDRVAELSGRHEHPTKDEAGGARRSSPAPSSYA